jgi:hypothetical protein
VRGRLVVKTFGAICLNLALLGATPTDGQGITGPSPTVSITAVSGYAGHAFVYAQVSNSTVTYPAPTGTHQSPFFSEWVPEPIASASCPWIWAVYVFERATGVQINAPSGNPQSPNFGTTTTMCASPTSSPVDEPAVADAAARLELDLRVFASPTVATVGSPTIVSGVLNSRLTQDLNLYLSMAIEDWSVTRWMLDFGDSQVRTVNGPVGTSGSAPHTYLTAGQYDARLIAFISGQAQAAVYDRYGDVHLVRRPFSVEVGNHAIITARPRPSRSYAAPRVAVGVAPSIGNGAPTDTVAFRHIDALRGALTTLSIHLIVLREGLINIDGTPTGLGQSRLTGWRLDGGPSDAPGNSGTTVGSTHRSGQPMRLQWNSPNQIVTARPEDYVVPVTLMVETHFSDGHVASYTIASSFSVTVNFAAQSG